MAAQLAGVEAADKAIAIGVHAEGIAVRAAFGEEAVLGLVGPLEGEAVDLVVPPERVAAPQALTGLVRGAQGKGRDARNDRRGQHVTGLLGLDIVEDAAAGTAGGLAAQCLGIGDGLFGAHQQIILRRAARHGLGAIYPAMANAVMALRVLGYADDDPRVVTAREAIERLMIERGDDIYFQPCVSPVWDTSLAAHAFLESGDREDPRLIRALDWLVDKQILDHVGDWAVRRTAPKGRTKRLRLGMCSCSNYAYGWFHAYRHLAEAEVDAVLHLGDYIYEYADGNYGGKRPLDPPHEIVTLDDYRRRFALNRLDPDLAEVHRVHPFIVTWDDHETANNAWTGGAENHDEGEGDWGERVAAAWQAYDEWMPVRPGLEGKLYRHLAFGDLVDIFVLDTRIVGRDQQTSDPDVAWDDARQLLGEAQEAWLLDALGASQAVWKLLAQQVMMAPLFVSDDIDKPRPVNADQWDAYPAARERILDVASGLDGVVVLTGDIHSSWANEIAGTPAQYDGTGANNRAVEFVTPGITSPGFPLEDLLGTLGPSHPWVRWANGHQRGYVVLTIERKRLQADWWLLPDGAVDTDAYVPCEWAAGMEVEHGVDVLVPADGPAE